MAVLGGSREIYVLVQHHHHTHELQQHASPLNPHMWQYMRAVIRAIRDGLTARAVAAVSAQPAVMITSQWMSELAGHAERQGKSVASSKQ